MKNKIANMKKSIEIKLRHQNQESLKAVIKRYSINILPTFKFLHINSQLYLILECQCTFCIPIQFLTIVLIFIPDWPVRQDRPPQCAWTDATLTGGRGVGRSAETDSRGDPDQMGQLPHGERWWVDDEEMMIIL